MRQLDPEDRAFADEVFAVFRKHGRLLSSHPLSGWYVEKLDPDDLIAIRRGLGLTDEPLVPMQAVTARARFHELLDRAMDLTREGEPFVGRFVNMLVKDAGEAGLVSLLASAEVRDREAKHSSHGEPRQE